MKKCEVQDVTGALAGKRVILGGAVSRTRGIFRREFLRAAAGCGCTVLDGTANTKKGDCVILFTDSEADGSVPVPQELLEELTGLCTQGPGTVLLVSDSGVYGRFYGDVRPRKESEMGYVGHTRPEDIPPQRMRLAEHIACRLAREKGLPVKAVRMPGISREDGAAAPLSQVFLAAIRVLLYGKNGEIYNLPEQEAHESEQLQPSPLSPQRLQMDSGKVEKLLC